MGADASDATAFGRLLRFWRTTFGKSQEELALELDSSPRHISRLENGRVLPSQAMVARIATTLGLGRRDTAHLLFAAGHTPPPERIDFQSEGLRWLRRMAAMMLRALDPYPSMLTDAVSEIHLVNQSWLGLLGFDPAAPTSVRQYYAFLLDAMAREGSDIGRDSQCGLLMTLQQEALIREDARLQTLVDELARSHEVPPDWRVRAALFEPMASFGVSIEVDGGPSRFFHVSRAIHPHGPSTYMTGGGLAIFSLLPDDQQRDWSFLVDSDLDHPRLATHELAGAR